jgi:hypothetical protein
MAHRWDRASTARRSAPGSSTPPAGHRSVCVDRPGTGISEQRTPAG